MEILRYMNMFLITKIPVCSIRVKNVLSAHVLDFFLVSHDIKANPISCASLNLCI